MAIPYPTITAPVVVGIDGSAASLAAVDLAAAEAVQRRRPLLVVHAYHEPYVSVGPAPMSMPAPRDGYHALARRLLGEAMERAEAAAPETAVDGEVISGRAAGVLLEAARDATMVVVGDRGVGGFAGLLLGSVAGHLAAHAGCPVLVTHGGHDSSRPVVVGVDGSPAGEAALAFGFEVADMRGADLWVRHAQTRHEPTDALGGSLPQLRTKYPDVCVRAECVPGEPRAALVEASREAQLLVVGTRGRGGILGLLLGSVSQAVLHHAACPVAVIPHGRH